MIELSEALSLLAGLLWGCAAGCWWMQRRWSAAYQSAVDALAAAEQRAATNEEAA